MTPELLEGARPAEEETPETTEDGAQETPEDDALPPEAAQIYRALMDPETKDEALKLIHHLTGYEPPKAQASEPETPKVSLDTKPADWAEGDWQYFQMQKPLMEAMFGKYLESMGLTREFLSQASETVNQVKATKEQTQAMDKAMKMVSIVRAELRKENPMVQFTDEQYREAVKAYPGYKFKHAVTLYLADAAKGTARGQTGAAPTIDRTAARMADGPTDPGNLAESIGRSLRAKMML